MHFQIKKKENYFLSQPHQPFFILGIANAIIMMLLFALSYKGVMNLHMDIFSFHVYSLVFMVFTNLFTGFLFTTFPRFCQAQVVSRNYYSKIFYANIIGSLLFLIGAFMSSTLVHIGMIALFISQIFIVIQLQNIYVKGMMKDKTDSFWILVAQYFGIFAHFLFFLGEFGFEMQNIAINIAFYMYIIFLTFSVAQRMIPFFSHSLEPKSKNLILIVFVLFLVKTVSSAFGFVFVQMVVDIILSLYLLEEFFAWKLPLFRSPAILWVLYLGLFWLPLALLFSALMHILELYLKTSFYFLDIHLLAIGFVTTILIGFGTRVVLGHSGQTPHADKFATGIFWFVQAVVVLRALYSINMAFGWGADFLFDISFSTWLILFLVWGGKYAKVLMFGYKKKFNFKIL